MPNDMREAYQREKRSSTQSSAGAKSLTDLVEIPDEIKEIYKRALSNVDDRPTSPKSLSELPKTKDLLPSDKSIYQPSQPIINPEKPTIEPDTGVSRLILSLVTALLLLGVAYAVMQFIQ